MPSTPIGANRSEKARDMGLQCEEKTIGEERRWEGRGTGDGTEEGK